MAERPVRDELLWYAVQVRAQHEKRVAASLAGKGYEQLVPVYRLRRKWSDRTKVLELPLFPGYVFVRLDPEVRLPILTIPGVLGFVGAGRKPQPLDTKEIEYVRTVSSAGHPAKPWPFLKVGQRVRITAGALTGVEGILVQRRGETRVVLSVTLLQKAISVQVESDAVRSI